jgi:predicted  nucleic acid-binding Zn-ribbon protein
MSKDATQEQLIARLDHLLSLVEPISGQLDNLEKQVNERLDRLEKQQAELSARLDNLETTVDQRLREIRPIWENVQSQLALLDKKIDTRADELRSETATGFRGVDRKIGVLSKNLVDMTADIQELRDVVEKLESQPA